MFTPHRCRLPVTSEAQTSDHRSLARLVWTTNCCMSPRGNADSNSFSTRWISRVRPWVMWVRALVRSRSCRIGSGGTNDARSSPWAPRSASQAASETSVLRARDVLHVTGVDQQHLQVGLQDVVERPPIVRRRLHHRDGDPLLGQVILQGQDLVGHRTPRRNRRRGLPSAATLDPDADLRVLLGHVDPRAPRVHDLHHAPHLPPACGRRRTGWGCVIRGGRKEQDSDTGAHRQQSTVPADNKLCPPPPN